MTNAEKYKDAIMAQMCETGNWAVDRTGKIMSCAWNSCAVCAFMGTRSYCWSEKKKWLNAEADEKKAFSEKDKEVLRGMDKINWVARDENGRVFGYNAKPEKSNISWVHYEGQYTDLEAFSTAEFAPVKWEDDEPTSRAEILGDEK